jgi:DNA end-binding protein Ku
MAARAIWKGNLKLESTSIPVKLYAAAQDRTVRFHVLDGKSLMRVKQHMINPETGDEVSNDEIKKGFEVEPGTFVIVEDKELESLDPKPSREIEIVQFVPPAAISPEFYDRPYYLAPDGDLTAYFALVGALKNKKREGVVRWAMRKQSYVGELRAEEDHLVMLTLRYSEKILSEKRLPPSSGRAPDKKELSMAKQLVELLRGEFNPGDYKDEYRQRIMEFVERKAKGRAPRLKLVKTKRKSTSLEKVLSKSIESLKKRAA